jgi:hypothetical protein
VAVVVVAAAMTTTTATTTGKPCRFVFRESQLWPWRGGDGRGMGASLHDAWVGMGWSVVVALQIWKVVHLRAQLW